uniref:Uncharacterized protein n=1 Tax=viral metagenome TaxID=1070528 RepID=A0A6M3LSC5_9ZZZZ
MNMCKNCIFYHGCSEFMQSLTELKNECDKYVLNTNCKKFKDQQRVSKLNKRLFKIK